MSHDTSECGHSELSFDSSPPWIEIVTKAQQQRQHMLDNEANLNVHLDATKNTATIRTPSSVAGKALCDVKQLKIGNAIHAVTLYGLAPDDLSKGLIPEVPLRFSDAEILANLDQRRLKYAPAVGTSQAERPGIAARATQRPLQHPDPQAAQQFGPQVPVYLPEQGTTVRHEQQQAVVADPRHTYEIPKSKARTQPTNMAARPGNKTDVTVILQ
ncbi:hypothetical protein HPB47_019293 [Ixodes persulcatus]|uniref:Uncharacterized protein n=1 Tax=Ixodes persulcatus TaxID=34615 RepID=A0AC60R1U1_IXOPE|nr:hypothetical protein HPB47_019293 [Ixodes persulcatus]